MSKFNSDTSCRGKGSPGRGRLAWTWRSLIVLVLLCLLAPAMRAQVSAHYNFSAFQGSYVPIASQGSPLPTGITSGGAYYEASTVLPIGFPFVFDGNTYTNLTVNTSGQMSFGQQIGIFPSSMYFPNGPEYYPGLSVFLGDHYVMGDVSYLVTGTAPNRVMTVEWLDVSWAQSPTPNISFQLKLYETTNMIQYVYHNIPSSPTGNEYAEIGLLGSATDFWALEDVSASPTLTNVNNNPLFDKPAEGQVYQFTPDPCYMFQLSVSSCNTSGEATAHPILGIAPYSYLWSNGGTTQTITGLGLGSYTVTVTDALGCVQTGTATVGVGDAIPPVINCPPNQTVLQTTCSGGNATYPIPVASDNCGNPTLTQIAGGASGSFFPTGTSVITYQATDASGNTSTCSFNLAITGTITGPVDYNLVGDALGNISTTCFQVTPNQGGAFGGIWYKDYLDLNFSFQMEFEAYFGNDEGGADGMAFVLQPLSTNAGSPGGGIGYQGIAPSLAVEFDTYQNGNFGDPFQDHIGVQLNGDVDHNSGAIVPPYVVGQMEDGQTHLVRFDWNATTHVFNIWYEGVLVRTFTQDITNTIFGGNSRVYWGWTGSTGGAWNQQSYCVSSLSFTTALSANATASSVPCVGGAIDLTVGGGLGPFTYTWNNGATTQDQSGLSAGTYCVTVADQCGQSVNTCVTVGPQQLDVAVPVITCPGSITVSNDSSQCGAAVTFAATATDDCSTPSISYSQASGSSFPVGTTTVTATATDAAGHSASCAFTVTVNDTEAPEVVCHDHLLEFEPGSNGRSISYGQVTSSINDNCGVNTRSVSPNFFTCADIGQVIPVLVTVTDFQGNISTCTSLVTVTGDCNEDPVAVCQNLTVPASGNCDGSANASAFDGGSTDPDGDSLTYSVAPAGPYGLGSTSVVLTVSDDYASSTCTATITVVDVTSPSITCPANLTRTSFAGICGRSVTFAATATDNCSATTLSYSPASGSIFPVGTTTVTATATDSAGNQASCAFTVTVFDAQAPLLSCHPITVSPTSGTTTTITASQVITSVTDNCGIASSTVSPNSFTCAQAGQTVLVFATVTDVHGISVDCHVNVTVSGDSCNQAPVAVCQNLTVNASGNCDGAATAADFNGGSTDPDGDPLTFSVAPAGPYGLGSTAVVLTVSDGQASSTCTATITVVDVTPPVITCPGSITVSNDPGQCGAAVTHNATATDNCAGVSVNQISGPGSGATFPVGTTTVTYSAVDGSGNSATCSLSVTVQDLEVPTAVCTNLTVALNSAGLGSVTEAQIGGSSSDNCGIRALSVSPSAFDCSNLGANTVTLTVYDTYGFIGNSSTCTAAVTVVDNAAPVAVCQNVTLTNGGTVTAAQVGGNSTDNCAIASMALSQSSFGCNNGGANTVVLTVTDQSGNSSTCTATVTVNVAPITVSLSSPLNSCGYNVSNCCLTHSGGSGSGDHGSGSGSGTDCGHRSADGTCDEPQCVNYLRGNRGSGHGNFSGHGHGGHGHGNLGGHGHGGSGSGNVNPCPYDGSATASATGGCGPYTYLWSTGQTSATISGLAPGLYLVTVTDASGHTAVQSITLTQAASLSGTVSTQAVTCYGGHNGSATAQGSGGCAPYTYHWSNGATSQTLQGLGVGSYSVTITDGLGCTVTATGTVSQPSRLNVDAGPNRTVYPSYAQQACATLSGSVSGGSAPYASTWTTQSGQVLGYGLSVVVCPSVTTVYYLNVTDAHGCTRRDSVAVCAQSVSCGNNKVQVCHTPPGNPGNQQTLCLNMSAVPAHLNHGDVLGACGAARNCRFPGSHGTNGHGHGHSKVDQGGANEGETPAVNIQAFPNPTAGTLTVEVSCINCVDDSKYSLQVTDMYGQRLLVTEVPLVAGEGELEIDLSRYAAGIYVVTLEGGETRIVERVVKQ